MTLLRWWLPVICAASLAAQTSNFGGDYSGMLGTLHLRLHLQVGAGGGAIEGALDSVDQGAMGLQCTGFHHDGTALSFDVPGVNGKWRGTISSDGATLAGTWSQGKELPLVFRRDEPFVPAATPSPVDGVWLGTLQAGGAKLRVQLHLKSDREGKEYCSVDSLDQGMTGLVCDHVQRSGSQLSFQVPAVQGHFSGTLADQENALDGVWSQGQDLPLKLLRQTAPVTLKPPPKPTYQPALAALSANELKATLDRDLEPALSDGALAQATGGGVVVGVIKNGVRRILVYGPVKEDSLFEIGSVTKTFTGLILARMVERKKITLEQPVRNLLPPGTAAKPEGAEITLLDLATQHSGLPRMPDNFHPADPQDPYADYGPANLYAFVAKHGLAKPADAGFLYSNLGFGLLGQALANRAGMTYPALLRAEVTGPLKLHDTVVRLSPEQQKRLAQGHTAQHQPAHVWNLDALAGAGAIRSTAHDMLTYLEAQLHPERSKGALAGALEMSHQLRADSVPEMKIALAWLYETQTGAYWHNGATGGYSSYVLFQPKEDYALVVLFNTTVDPGGSFADRLGKHVAERLSGRPAVSLK